MTLFKQAYSNACLKASKKHVIERQQVTPDPAQPVSLQFYPDLYPQSYC